MSPTKSEAVREKLWDVAGAAEYLGVSISWVYQRSASGELPCRKVGRSLRFVPSDLAAWVANQPGTSVTKGEPVETPPGA